jgi:perosamine synthetase
VRKLEERAAEQLDGARVVSVNSATSGLYAAVGALGLGYGDEVIVSPYTMSACAVAPLIYGAIPVFADVEIETGCLSAAAVTRAVTPRTRAILLVHQFGIPADMDAIMAVAREHSLRVIEDCAQAWGASYKGRPVGTMGDVGVFSFNVNKTVQSGEGGLCVTNDSDLAYRLQLIRNHGEAVVASAGYEDITNIVGFNYRMTELQAAVAHAQLGKLDRLNAARLELVERLSRGLSEFDCLVTPPGRDGCVSTYYVYPLRYLDDRLGGLRRGELVAAVNAEGIRFQQGYVAPLYTQPLYQQRRAFKHGYPWTAPENADSEPDYSPGACPNAETLHGSQMIINEHVRPPHGAADVDDIVAAVGKVIGAVTGGHALSGTPFAAG